MSYHVPITHLTSWQKDGMFTSDRLIAGLQPAIVYSVYTQSAVCTHDPGRVLTVAEAGIEEAASH